MVLPTIFSRCQHIPLLPIDDESLKDSIKDKKIDHKEIVFRANGDYNRMNNLLKEDNNMKYEKLIVEGLRLAFKAKGGQKIVGDLINWSDNLSSLGREDQKEFLAYSIQFFRDAFLINYKLDSLIHFRSSVGFDIHKLAPYIHPGNILELIDLFEKNHFYIIRNASSKMIFSNLSLKLALLINVRKD
jgi:DNA polymerase-3 subunit delta'